MHLVKNDRQRGSGQQGIVGNVRLADGLVVNPVVSHVVQRHRQGYGGVDQKISIQPFGDHVLQAFTFEQTLGFDQTHQQRRNGAGRAQCSQTGADDINVLQREHVVALNVEPHGFGFVEFALHHQGAIEPTHRRAGNGSNLGVKLKVVQGAPDPNLVSTLTTTASQCKAKFFEIHQFFFPFMDSVAKKINTKQCACHRPKYPSITPSISACSPSGLMMRMWGIQ